MQEVEDRQYMGRHWAPGERTGEIQAPPRQAGEKTVKLPTPRPTIAMAVEYRSQSLADDHVKTRVIQLGHALRAQVRALWVGPR
jgi:hypothetical protein